MAWGASNTHLASLPLSLPLSFPPSLSLSLLSSSFSFLLRVFLKSEASSRTTAVVQRPSHKSLDMNRCMTDSPRLAPVSLPCLSFSRSPFVPFLIFVFVFGCSYFFIRVFVFVLFCSFLFYFWSSCLICPCFVLIYVLVYIFCSNFILILCLFFSCFLFSDVRNGEQAVQHV